MKIYFELFWIFFKIGAFTLGGGYAMVPLIQNEIVGRKKWIGKEDFIDMLALAQSAPGALAVNTAVFVGYKVKGVSGALVTAIAGLMPSVIIIWILAALFTNFQNNPYVIKAFKAIRPMVVALIAVSVYTIGKQAKINKITIWIVILIAGLVSYMKFPPIAIIVLAAVSGNIFMVLKKREGKNNGHENAIISFYNFL